MTVSEDQMNRYLSGEALYGDNFTGAQLEQWFADEREGYADLGAKDRDAYTYRYHGLNRLHGFNRIGRQPINRVLGFGSAYGDELLPIINRVKQITILEPSEALTSAELQGVPVEYIKPTSSGKLPFEDSTFDLITCLDTLHHVPNVTFVIGEMARCLTPGGHVIFREPIVSMGDWRGPRPGLTKHERGIPQRYLRDCVTKAGLRVVYEHLCMCRFVSKLWPKSIGGSVYNSPIGTRLDSLTATLLKWNVRYHATTKWQKLRPGEVYVVARKPGP